MFRFSLSDWLRDFEARHFWRATENNDECITHCLTRDDYVCARPQLGFENEQVCAFAFSSLVKIALHFSLVHGRAAPCSNALVWQAIHEIRALGRTDKVLVHALAAAQTELRQDETTGARFNQQVRPRRTSTKDSTCIATPNKFSVNKRVMTKETIM